MSNIETVPGSTEMTANPTITVFERSPDGGRGLARDMPVRWALEEVGQPYHVRRLSFAAMKETSHLAYQPFGQIPSYEQGDLVLFESGAIVLHIAQHHRGLLPEDPLRRARTIARMFAALNTIEPPVLNFSTVWLFERDEPWHEARLARVKEQLLKRLDELSAWFGDREWLEGSFSAADILMICVLRRLESSRILKDYRNLLAYLDRGKARPAFQRAYDAQLAVFTAAPKN
ncbi:MULTISPECIES: glutathione S-transferase family protein [Agrobacterium]|uniref:Glutathione S-transferase family protein n=1 Tax=Agrobacterium tumefaciens TaxID=358 RepID=A0AAE6BHG6_AGRTU|nr:MULTISPECIES: glutathione S-transferase family protein [Agrobacterium]QCL75587.1 glutathione S-transferase family protein [Agrobacterium tumefaciens]QCL81149.1 glutathione S-transferase family protein [Agrobacterium tumefaciens]CUX57815.1 Glutathione S-transferase [Agrobacterium sp. NCPPB 925]